jgi:cytochrome c553
MTQDNIRSIGRRFAALVGLAAFTIMLAGAAGAQDAAKPAAAAAPKANIDAARNKVAMCQGCHNIANWRASFPEVYRVPMIAGQSAKYLEVALQQYKKGDRKHPTMRAIAETLSDQDIVDIAAYYAGLGKDYAH